MTAESTDMDKIEFMLHEATNDITNSIDIIKAMPAKDHEAIADQSYWERELRYSLHILGEARLAIAVHHSQTNDNNEPL